MRDLTTAEHAYRKSAERTEALRAKRNAAILAALEASHSQAEIAKATGLTSGRINQIVKGVQQSE